MISTFAQCVGALALVVIALHLKKAPIMSTDLENTITALIDKAFAADSTNDAAFAALKVELDSALAQVAADKSAVDKAAADVQQAIAERDAVKADAAASEAAHDATEQALVDKLKALNDALANIGTPAAPPVVVAPADPAPVDPTAPPPVTGLPPVPTA